MATELIAIMPSMSVDEIMAMILPNGGNVATESYVENLVQNAVIETRGYTDLMMDDHLMGGNPHSITPTMINAYGTQWQSLNLSLATGWNKYHSTAWQPRINFNENLVHLSGLVKPSSNAGNTICQLHPIFRPKDTIMSICLYLQSNSVKTARVDIGASGAVVVSGVRKLTNISYFMLPNMLYVSQR